MAVHYQEGLCPTANQDPDDSAKKVNQILCNAADGSVPFVVQIAGSSGGSTVVDQVTVLRSSSAEFNRPNDTNAYLAGDVISNSTSSPSVLTFSGLAPAAGDGLVITTVRIMIQSATVPSGLTALRLHLYKSAPTAINDNAAFSSLWASRAVRVGFIDVGSFIANGGSSDSIHAMVTGNLLTLDSTTTDLFGILETRGAFTPAANTGFFVQLTAIKA